jgi:hypothetical protein
MTDIEKAKLKDYIDELRAELNYWSISIEANTNIEKVIEKIEKDLIEQ